MKCNSRHHYAKATPETLKIMKKRGAAGAAAAKAEAEAAEAEEEGGGRGKRGAGKFTGKSGGKNGGRGQKGGNAVAVDGDIVPDEHPGFTEISLRASQMLDRQTFVFSATLTVPDNVRKKLKKRHAHSYNPDTDGGGKAGEKKRLDKSAAAAAGGASAGTLGTLMEAVPFYGRVKLVDLTDQSQTVAKRVMESSLECTEVRLSLSHTRTFSQSLTILHTRTHTRARAHDMLVLVFKGEKGRKNKKQSTRRGSDYNWSRLKLSCGNLPYSNATSLI